MPEAAAAVPSLDLGARLLVSLAILAALSLVAILAYRRPGRIDEWTESWTATATLLAGFAVTVLVAAVTLVVLWNAVSPTLALLGGASSVMDAVFRVAVSLAIVAGAYVATGAIHRVIADFVADHDAISRHQSEIIYRTIQLTVYVAALIVVLGIWRFNLRGFLVGAGFLGIIVGMAARQTLGAVIAGFVLMFSRPFEIGDWIQIEDDEGIVTDITIVNTRLETFEGEYVVVPNDVVSGSTITNRTQKGRLRIRVDVGVDYEADPEHASDVAKEAMTEVDDVLTVPGPDVVLTEFGESAVTLGLRFWIDKPSARRKWRAQTAVIRAVKRAFDEEGIKIPYPQRELTGRGESGGFGVAGGSRAEESAADGGER